METTAAPPDIVPYATEKNDRFVACDACGNKSWYFVKISGTDMSYCGHHATKFEVNLLAKADEPPRDLRYLI
jgi:hypothetical protein